VKIGIVGGIGPESTIDYYKMIIQMYRDAKKDDHYPVIVIHSIDMKRSLAYSEQGDESGLAEYISDAVRSLAQAGSDVGLIASNTPHIVFDRVQATSPIPLLSIVRETCRHVVSLGCKKVGLLGTRFTMQSDYYQKEFTKFGIALPVPNSHEQEYIHSKLFSEIEHGIFREDTRQGLLAIVRRMKEEERIQGVILGCTELPLILAKDEFDIPFFNTSRIHAQSAVNYLLAHE
jgi:aspartate racemase